MVYMQCARVRAGNQHKRDCHQTSDEELNHSHAELIYNQNGQIMTLQKYISPHGELVNLKKCKKPMAKWNSQFKFRRSNCNLVVFPIDFISQRAAPFLTNFARKFYPNLCSFERFVEVLISGRVSSQVQRSARELLRKSLRRRKASTCWKALLIRCSL